MENKRKKVILVDDNITNLTIGKNVLMNEYDVMTVSSGEKLLKILERIIPDLILLDIEMPEMNGYETIKILKSNEKTAQIPVIFLTAKDDTGSEFEGLSLGATDYISKPFSPPLLLKHIEVHLLVEYQRRELKNYNDNLQEMVMKKTKTVLELQNAVIETVVELVECRDDITGGHIDRTQKYLKVLIDALVKENFYHEEVSSWDNIDFLFQSAQLHDIGKIAIKDCILQKPGKLTDEEYEIMKGHTTFGVTIIEKNRRKSKGKLVFEACQNFCGSAS